ncbi:HMG box protein [Sporothrix schenckii 1099-18]|uniref:HMG box protein n=1 Tax=Sporothrix schenckii 1099-18 TaxID=1397361 RepID=A0A0F2M5M9_SPOSC|nr:HMG box protein [Sporothrix schenckii 1099-18]KJR84419.1 HMG box protein [Sporothrix schenckii 1099-18]
MLSANVLRVGAAAAGRSFTMQAAGVSTGAPLVSRQAALNAFRAQSTRGFMAATAVAAAATTKASPKKKATTAKKTATKAAPKKTAAAAAAAEKKKKAAAAAKKKAAAAKKKAALTPEEKAKAQKRELKKVALLHEPRKLPEHPWILFITESTTGTKAEDGGKANLAKIMPGLSQAFKALSPLELQRLRDTSERNRASNAEAYKEWVEGHTVSQIADANRARLHLNRLGKTTKHRSITDARQPRRPTSSFSLFTKERWESGDFTGRPLADAARALSTEWKNLSSSERQRYDDIAKAEADRYGKEVKSTFGRTVSKSPSPSA